MHRGGRRWSITALLVLAEHAEWRQGNPLAVLILVSLAKKLLEQETETGAAARISPGGQHFTATTKRGDS